MTDYLSRDHLEKILGSLMPDNQNALTVSMCTGLRISDVLGLKWCKFSSFSAGAVLSLTECKTGKNRTIVISQQCGEALAAQRAAHPQSDWVFPGRGGGVPRTRQAVWKDLKRASRLWRFDGRKVRENLGPHSARKVYAVELYRSTGDLETVRKALNHRDPAVTLVYAMADKLTAERLSVTDCNSELTSYGK